MNLIAQLAQAATPAPSSSGGGGTTQTVIDTIAERGVDIGLKIVAAIVAWIIGAWIIRMLGKVAKKAMLARKLDDTLSRYLSASLGVVLKILLIVAILGIFGIETTSFAAFFAAAGVAIVSRRCSPGRRWRPRSRADRPRRTRT